MVGVVAAHVPCEYEPLVLSAGDAVHLVGHDDEWPLWIWCEKDRGAGWVPETYVDAGETGGVANRTYTSREIAVAAGDAVEVLERYGGWVFVRTSTGEEGWILELCLESE